MKTTFVGAEKMREIIREYPTPFHLYDETGIRENIRRLKAAFSWNKGYREYFAVKATPTPALLRIFKEEGCGVDCSSYTELLMAQACGFSGEDIMFSSNVTPAEDFILASELDACINFDDIAHVDFYEKLAPLPETVCCRYNPGGDFAVNSLIMDTPGDAKYGFTFDQLVKGYKSMMAKGVKHFGLHAFLASNVTDNAYYPALAEVLFKTAVRLKNETGAHVAFINLSGGIGIPYLPDQESVDIAAVGEGVRKAFEKILHPAGMGDVAIFTELGRYMTGPYGCLVSAVTHMKHIHKDYVGLDACAANLMRPAMYKAYHHITVLGKEHDPRDHKYDVTGGLCENNDKFAIDRMLPETTVGDVLVIHDTGAHGFSMGYNYNGKLRSAELLLRSDGTVEMIQRPQTPDDYFATFSCDADFYSKLKR